MIHYFFPIFFVLKNEILFQLDHLYTLRKKYSYSELFWSVFFPDFPAFGLNTERCSVALRIHSEYVKMREKCGPE